MQNNVCPFFTEAAPLILWQLMNMRGALLDKNSAPYIAVRIFTH